jgi:hypothetical protein
MEDYALIIFYVLAMMLVLGMCGKTESTRGIHDQEMKHDCPSFFLPCPEIAVES